MLPAHWTEHDLTLNGNRFHYYHTGRADKPPLVLVHGFSDNGLCWLQTALDLENDYDIYLPEARGHGKSERVRPGETVDMPGDLAAIIQALGLERPIVGGHSMGAMEAFQVGVRFPAIPRALLLEDPPWRQPQDRPAVSSANEHPMKPWVDTTQRLSLNELKDLARTDHPNWPDWVVNTWCAAKKELDPNILSILNIRGTDWAEDAPKLQCPTLVVTADVDKGGIVSPEIAARVQELNPRIQVKHVPGVGHHVRFGDYDTYMAAVRAFLNEIG